MMKQVSSKTKLLESGIKRLNYEQQRFKRYLPQPKPLWKPMSVQNLFNIPQQKKLLPEDEECIDQEEPVYLDKYRSIKEYLYQNFTIPVFQGGTKTDLREAYEEHEKMLEENRQENERMARVREERLKVEQKEEDLLELKKRLVENEKYLVKKDMAIQLILREKARQPTYITKEKLKDAIEAALDHSTSYDFAIDLNGTLVFEKALHPYALKPSAVPESDDILHDFVEKNPAEPIRLEPKKLFY